MTECTSVRLEFNSLDMKLYVNRLKTFDLWSSQIQPNKFDLCSAGFYYIGRSDIVECFSCGLRLYQWKKWDNPLTEHNKFSTNCLFINMITNSPMQNTQKFVDKSSCRDIWPSTGLFWDVPDAQLSADNLQKI